MYSSDLKIEDVSCQKCQCSTEADGLHPIIEQQANEIVELQNKIRVLEQDLASAESGLQGRHSHDKIKSYTGFL